MFTKLQKIEDFLSKENAQHFLKLRFVTAKIFNFCMRKTSKILIFDVEKQSFSNFQFCQLRFGAQETEFLTANKNHKQNT
jgi:hypothetical protein